MKKQNQTDFLPVILVSPKAPLDAGHRCPPQCHPSCLGCPQGSCGDKAQSTGPSQQVELGQGGPEATPDGQPKCCRNIHTSPGSATLPAQTPESRGSKLKTSSHKAHARLWEPGWRPHLPHLPGWAGKAAGQLPRSAPPWSVPRAPLCCRRRESLSVSIFPSPP